MTEEDTMQAGVSLLLSKGLLLKVHLYVQVHQVSHFKIHHLSLTFNEKFPLVESKQKKGYVLKVKQIRIYSSCWTLTN